MPSTTAKKSKRRQPVIAIDETTVLRTVRAVYEEAEQTVNAACAALRTLGLLDRRDGRVITVPTALMLKLGAMMRIYQWQNADLIQLLKGQLPSADQVAADLLDNGGIYDGHQLGLQVFRTWFRQMAHNPLPSGGDIVINRINAQDILAELAKFLWENRNTLIHKSQE